MPKRETGERDALADLESSLRIDKNSLDDALINQPDLYYRVAREYSFALSRRDKAKNDLETTRAEADGKIRNDANKSSDKITEASIMQRILLNADVKEAIADMAQAQGEMSRWLVLKDAYEQRSYALKDLTALYVSGYFTDRAGSGARRDAGDRKYEAAKEGLAEARRADRRKG